MDELTRVRKYERLGNHHTISAERALRQHMLANSPLLRFVDTVHLWFSAGKAFAVAGEWEDAGRMFAQCAEMALHTISRGRPTLESALYFLKSAEMKRRFDPAEAIDPYVQAIFCFRSIGRFLTAANLAVCVAEVYDEEQDDFGAIEYYQKASQYYQEENYHHQSTACLLKVAHRAAMIERFEFATETFDTVAKVYVEDNLLRLNMPNIFLRGALCQLAAAGSIRGTLNNHKVLRWYMTKWCVLDFTFTFSREHLFLENLLSAIANADIHMFVDHIYSFDNISHLDTWCLTLLNRVREDIEEEIDRRASEEEERKNGSSKEKSRERKETSSKEENAMAADDDGGA